MCWKRGAEACPCEGLKQQLFWEMLVLGGAGTAELSCPGQGCEQQGCERQLFLLASCR